MYVHTSIESVMERTRRAIERIRSGGMIIVRDSHDRENEGDIIYAAEHASTNRIAFMAVQARGLICQAIKEDTAARLGLHPMVARNNESNATAFTVSVDAIEGTTTGISAADRAKTVAVIVDPKSLPSDLCKPGHLFPLIAREGGVFARPGHTEAAVDLARLAGLRPSGVICEVLNDDGSMARGPELDRMSQRWDLPLISVEDLITYRDCTGDFELVPSTEAKLPTNIGSFMIRVYRSNDPGNPESVLLSTEEDFIWKRNGPPVVRVHSECMTGEALHSTRCDCGAQLQLSMREVARLGGYIIYLRQEGRGIGLFEKIRAYTLQDDGLDTVDANLALGHQIDGRRFGVAASILRDIGVTEVQLMTNNPNKVHTLEAAGIAVSRRLSIEIPHTIHSRSYLMTKASRMGHELTLRTP